MRSRVRTSVRMRGDKCRRCWIRSVTKSRIRVSLMYNRGRESSELRWGQFEDHVAGGSRRVNQLRIQSGDEDEEEEKGLVPLSRQRGSQSRSSLHSSQLTRLTHSGCQPHDREIYKFLEIPRCDSRDHRKLGDYDSRRIAILRVTDLKLTVVRWWRY